MREDYDKIMAMSAGAVKEKFFKGIEQGCSETADNSPVKKPNDRDPLKVDEDEHRLVDDKKISKDEKASLNKSIKRAKVTSACKTNEAKKRRIVGLFKKYLDKKENFTSTNDRECCQRFCNSAPPKYDVYDDG